MNYYQNFSLKSKHLIFITCVSLILRLFFLIFYEGFNVELKEDPLDYFKIAKYAANNGILNWQSHSRPPLLSIIIIPLLKIFPEFLTLISIKVLMISISIFNCVIIYILAFEISKNNKISLISSLIFSFYPFSIFMSGKLLTENLASLLISLICLFLIKFFKNKKIKFLIIFSFLLGLLSLTRSSYFYLPFFFIISFFFFKTSLIKKFLSILIMFIIFFATLSPWIVKNYIQLNEIVPTTTRLGVGLWYSNNDFTDPLIKKGGYNKHTSNFKKEAEFAKKLNPINKSEYLKKKSLEEIKKNKIQFIKVCINRFINMLSPKPNPYTQFKKKDIVMIAFYTPFLIIFLLSILRKKFSLEKIILLIPIFYTLVIHLPFYGIPRFRFPIDNLIFLSCILYLFEKIKLKSIKN